MKNKNLSFYQFPRESSTKEKWLNLLGIQKQILKSHKVCSLHFPGGRKMLNALPTAPMSSHRQTKNSSEGRCSTDVDTTVPTIVEQQSTEDESEQQYNKLETEHAELKTKYEELSNKYKQCVLRLEHVIASDANFKFYTSFPNYATFKAFFNYLQPACNSLMYAGSCNTEHVEATQQKHG